MNLYHLRVFLTVAELEHITRASQELFLSQSAVSKTIQSLEQEVGLLLIERQGRRIVLTPAGKVLQVYARRIFSLEREMEDALAALKDLEAGEVTIGASKSTGVYLLPPVVARFRELHPRVMLNISILNSHEVVEQTLNWRLDFGLVEGDPSTLPEGLVVDRFAKDELVLVIAPNHRWQGLQAIRPEMLQGGELLLREVGSGTREVIEQALLAHGVRVQPLLTLPDNETMKQMVMSGVGAAILPAIAVRREVAAGDLLQVLVTGLDLHRELSLVRRTDKQLSRAARAFCEIIHPDN